MNECFITTLFQSNPSPSPLLTILVEFSIIVFECLKAGVSKSPISLVCVHMSHFDTPLMKSMLHCPCARGSVLVWTWNTPKCCVLSWIFRLCLGKRVGLLARMDYSTVTLFARCVTVNTDTWACWTGFHRSKRATRVQNRSLWVLQSEKIETEVTKLPHKSQE